MYVSKLRKIGWMLIHNTQYLTIEPSNDYSESLTLAEVLKIFTSLNVLHSCSTQNIPTFFISIQKITLMKLAPRTTTI